MYYKYSVTLGRKKLSFVDFNNQIYFSSKVKNFNLKINFIFMIKIFFFFFFSLHLLKIVSMYLLFNLLVIIQFDIEYCSYT